MPPYIKQTNSAACSLAVLRMVLAHHGHAVSEQALLAKVEADYGKTFKNIWNPTIAKLACEFGLRTRMHAQWPLFKPQVMRLALAEFRSDPEHMDIRQYENPDDTDGLPEPLTLAYQEMFRAVELGCGYEYGNINDDSLKDWLEQGFLVQTSIKLERMYPDAKTGFHSILVFAYEGDRIKYHDPDHGPNLSCTIPQLLKAMDRVGAVIIYEGLAKSP